jgi:hypothetical protein
VVARTKAWVYGSSLAGDGCLSLVSVVFCQRSLQRTDHSSRGVLPSVACLRRKLREATLHITRQRVQSVCERAASKLIVPITRRNGKAGQSATSALVHHSTSQR